VTPVFTQSLDGFQLTNHIDCVSSSLRIFHLLASSTHFSHCFTRQVLSFYLFWGRFPGSFFLRILLVSFVFISFHSMYHNVVKRFHSTCCIRPFLHPLHTQSCTKHWDHSFLHLLPPRFSGPPMHTHFSDFPLDSKQQMATSRDTHIIIHKLLLASSAAPHPVHRPSFNMPVFSVMDSRGWTTDAKDKGLPCRPSLLLQL
jgi:hypothetical protein